ncbi:DNA polymerase III subunit beta [candidate division WWE3 bacterium CG_4_9_14_0_2_um_filter_35_11]|uniref:Beta sliding clamp n=1 Tax=candidate division WWE3 bacterium CG_4_9_14_0_2_um_filter_35_11 TaxID=1975077 RepID=A0A2M8EL69_UNCKA|nr:MAG: DNA polymerase III subunit beta [candidate division WWE3 bacterium CG10_big_fil_rev_8_21_14_0_10_35_32]PJC23450.1 MAG: DNA polymerase III subunit beta [candidate division WWE3 bacterium CG_4_9_14_0_2_um_filter_35_11]
MKFTVIRENLSNALNVVSKAVNQRSPLPILSNILIKTEKGMIQLFASDLQMSISASVGAKIDEPGEITVPAKIFIEFVNQVNSDKIDFSLSGAVLKLSTDKVNATLSGIPASEFPVMDRPKKGYEVTLPSDLFSKAIQKVQYVVAIDEGRPVLTGIYFKITKNELVIAGTDGYRMAEYSFGLQNAPFGIKEDEVVSCVVPAKAFSENIKAFAGKSNDMTFAIYPENNVVTLKVDDYVAQIRMIDGEYPDYLSVVPSEFSTSIVIDSSEFSNGIKLASIFARDIGNMIKLVIKDGVIESISQPSESGSNITKMSADVEGEDIAIAFNAKYLLDFVSNQSSSGDIIFKTSDPLKPVLFSVNTEENYFAEGKKINGFKRYFHLIMPMKSSW